MAFFAEVEMCWTSEHSMTRQGLRDAPRADCGAVQGGLSPLDPKTPRNGESGAVSTLGGCDVKCCCKAGYGNCCSTGKSPTFTTWASAVVKAESGRKPLCERVLSAGRAIHRGGRLVIVVTTVRGRRGRETRAEQRCIPSLEWSALT